MASFILDTLLPLQLMVVTLFLLVQMQGVTQPKNDGFSLSSGDFPSLGSDKDKSVPNSELQGIIFWTNIMISAF